MKAKIKILSIAFAVIFSKGFSQDRVNIVEEDGGLVVYRTICGELISMKINGPEYFFIDGAYSRALTYCKEKIANDPNDFESVLQLSQCYAQLGKNDSAIFYLSEYLKMNIDSNRKFFSCQTFNYLNIVNDARFEKIAMNCMSYASEKQGAIKNRKLAYEWWKLGMAGESYRGGWTMSQVKEFYNDDAFIPYQKKLDSLNSIQMEKLIKKYGWPLKSQVGKGVAYLGFFTLMHSTLDLMKKYKPLLEKAVNQNEGQLENLCFLKDRILILEGKGQCFGTQMNYDFGGITLCPIEDRSNVDERRKAAGLNSLDEYLADFGDVKE